MTVRDFDGAPVLASLAGERAPAWLPAGLALAGILLAIASAWLGLSAQSGQAARAWPGQWLDQRAVPPPRNAGGDGETKPQPGGAPGRSAAQPEPANLERTILPSPSLETRGGESASAGPKPVPESVARAEQVPADCAPVVSVPFARDSVAPAMAGARGDLQALVGFLKRHPQAKLAVEGHADASGEDQHNLFLSYRRAKAVVPALASIGIAEDRVVLSAVGANALVEGLPGSSPENRRVVLQVRGSSCPAGESPGGPQ